MAIAEILPVLALAPLAGAVMDRLPAVRVMIAADLWRATLAALLPLVDQHLAAVYAVAFGLSAGGVFFNPAAAAILPRLVATCELVTANSALWSAAVTSQIALAPLAGALVAAVGVAPAFGLNAASFAASALLLAGLHPPPIIASAIQPAGSWARRIADGARLLLVGRSTASGAEGSSAPHLQRLALSSDSAKAAQLGGLRGQRPGLSPERASLCKSRAQVWDPKRLGSNGPVRRSLLHL